MASRRIVSVVVSLSYLASGCVSTPPASLQSIPHDAKFAYAVGQFHPHLSVDTTGAAAYAGKGALRGIRACSIPGGGFISAIIFFACAPFGTVIGAIEGSAGAASSEDVQTAEARMASASKAINFPEMTSGVLSSYAGRVGLKELNGQGPKSIDDKPRYAAAADYVIEIMVATGKAESPGSPNLPYAFVATVNGRLVRVSDNATLDSFTRTAKTPAMQAAYWSQNPQTLLAELRRAVGFAATGFINEWVLVYRDDAQDQPRATQAADFLPAYVLRPRSWPIQDSRRLVKLLTELAVVCAESTAPTLTWDSLPADVPAAWFNAPNPRARHLVYDVLIMRGDVEGMGAGSTAIIPRTVMRRYNGLKETSVRVEPPLAEFNYYFWTVRARFELDGRPRMTEWSGAFNKSAVADPRSLRRRGLDGAESRFFYPFATPGGPGGGPCINGAPVIPRG